MEDLSSLFCYEETPEELKQKLVYMAYELQSARVQVEQQVRRNKESMESAKQLLNLLRVAYKERDEARAQVQKLLLTSPAPSPGSPLFGSFHGKSSSGLTESNSLSGDSLYDVVSPEEQIDPGAGTIYRIAKGRPLPTRGKLLEAVMGAGPLLRTLMVAGPMPRWRNPPPLQAIAPRLLNFAAGGMCLNDAAVEFGTPALKRHRIQ